MVVLLSEFDFAHVKMANAVDLVVLVNHRRGLALRFRQRQIDEVLNKQTKMLIRFLCRLVVDLSVQGSGGIGTKLGPPGSLPCRSHNTFIVVLIHNTAGVTNVEVV